MTDQDRLHARKHERRAKKLRRALLNIMTELDRLADEIETTLEKK